MHFLEVCIFLQHRWYDRKAAIHIIGFDPTLYHHIQDNA